MSPLPSFQTSPIDGLLEIELDIRGDSRGWFQEVWQAEKWSQLGLPQFFPVQQNVSSNEELGVTRGLHAEPWNKVVTVTAGRAFCAWVDLRPGPGFGVKHSRILEPGSAVIVPRGVANGYQTLEGGTVYSYLVDAHWSPEAKYVLLNPFDAEVDIPWPIEKSKAIVSEKDAQHPALRELSSMNPPAQLVLGGNGQVGSELLKLLPNAIKVDRAGVSSTLEGRFNWAEFIGIDAVVFNAAAYTSVDSAELQESWEQVNYANAILPWHLAKATKDRGATLVHYSSDYVFDGRGDELISEDRAPNPLGIYGRTKLLGDFAAMINPRHYILRTSWVFGSGKNFVDSIRQAALLSRDITVVNDQFGRPTAAQDLAMAGHWLVANKAPYGLYNFSGAGPLVSWYELARFIYSGVGADASLVKPCSTAEYGAGKHPFAPRPRNSGLDLRKISDLGFPVLDWQEAVSRYLARS
jgi:dTDP-4-dehydrorhamnose reductase/dTDP-4-dehydrorhamnose 3,5-epimerase